MSERRDEVDAHLDSVDLGGDAVLGTLRRSRRGATSVVSFGFDREWLAHRRPFVIDPSLGLHEGDQYVEGGRLPAIFSDSAPDRWGRTLMQRRESAVARRENRRPRTLDDWDFLVGVNDELRMGAIRLWSHESQSFVADEDVSVPPLARLRQLQFYAQRAERGEQPDIRDEDEELALLIAPGSSLGGTRPKANVRGEDGSLWIAKFPAGNDSWDVGRWEGFLSHVASKVGIVVPESSVVNVAGQYHTFLSRRFDRLDGGRRAYASAMTLTGKHDREQASYLDIADAITRFGSRANIDSDLAQLFRRLVFNVVVGNRDDHLRNHGFVGSSEGWRLSPVFDVNPAPEMVEHALRIDSDLGAPDLDLVRETARYYRLSAAEAKAIVEQVEGGLADWQRRARAFGLSQVDIDRMGPAFSVQPN